MEMKTKKKIVDGLRAYVKHYGKQLRKKQGQAPELPKGMFDYGRGGLAQHYTAGFGKAPMVPPDMDKKTYYMAGYGNNKPITGVMDKTCAHALWLDDNSGRGGILMISVDCVGLLNSDINGMRENLEGFVRMTGCRGINICSTHTHAGIDTMGIYGKLPKSGKDAQFMRIVYAAVKVAAERAYGDRRDGELFFGSTEAEGIQKDIRKPEVFSKTLTRLRFVPFDGTRESWLVNFAAHAEMLDWHNTLVSADYPAFLRKRIREKTGAETIFFQGAIGGMITGEETHEDPVETTRCMGEALADAAIAIVDARKLAPNVSTLRQEVYFPAQNLVLFLAGRVKILAADVHSRPDSFYNVCLKSEMNYIEIDDVKCLLIPGELFPELLLGGALDADSSGTGQGPEANPPLLTEIANDPNLLVFGLANDEIGYIVPPNDFCLNPDAPFLEDLPKDRTGRKHYEETNSLGITTAPIIADTFAGMMRTVELTKARAEKK